MHRNSCDPNTVNELRPQSKTQTERNAPEKHNPKNSEPTPNKNECKW
jgi:hypothetical protein